MKKTISLNLKYPPSKPCSCDICTSYCQRPGWWTIEEAERAIDAGYSSRMMLEMAPDMTFGVLSPSFYGCEGYFAMNLFSKEGCNFLKNGLCELHGTDFIPLECRFCHHDRVGEGKNCHSDLEKMWNSNEGRTLVARWSKIVELLKKVSKTNG
ncbi:MAG: hypothetical protein NT007_12935 [Candidatus Kapabacteria bacterium]|nr:hypothetical protein [Candidatus Kapabacteria bacterium]